MKMQRRSRAGFTLIELMIVITLIGVLAAAAVPSYQMARKKANANACALTRKNLDGAKLLWAQENRRPDEDIPTLDDLKPWLDNFPPECGAGGAYTIGPVNTKAACSVHRQADAGR